MTRRPGRPKSRETQTTELGEEVRCAACGEFWPADKEFFYFTAGQPHSWCKACYQVAPSVLAQRERLLTKQREQRALGKQSEGQEA